MSDQCVSLITRQFVDLLKVVSRFKKCQSRYAQNSDVACNSHHFSNALIINSLIHTPIPSTYYQVVKNRVKFPTVFNPCGLQFRLKLSPCNSPPRVTHVDRYHLHPA